MAPSASEIELDAVLSRLRRDLSRKGHHCMVVLRRILYQAGLDHGAAAAATGQLNYAEFEQGLGRAGLFLPLPHLTLLYRRFDLQRNRRVSIEAFMQALVGELSPARQHLVRGLYGSLRARGQSGADDVAVADLLGRLRPERHPKVLAQDKTASAVRLEIADLVQAFSEGGRITARQFHDLFGYLGASMPLHDAAFADVVAHVFYLDAPAAAAAGAASAGGDTGPVDAAYLQCVGQVLKEKIRQKTRGQESEILTLTRVFRHFDIDDSGRVDYHEWNRALERFGILMPDKESRALFAQHDPGRTGHLRYDQFVHDLYQQYQPQEP